jgi:long-chain acyl-CoA synthetase
MLTSLGQVLPAAAAKYGDKTALIADDKTFSFRELDQLSNALAISLTKLGVAAGDRITLMRPIHGNGWSATTAC